MSVTQE
jgi:hypothetical protein